MQINLPNYAIEYRATGLMGKVFTYGLGDRASIAGRVIQMT